MILLDWTRMGRSYCLAGAMAQQGGYRIVRPLLAKNKNAPVRNVGWSAWQLDGHVRWEIFELLGPESAELQPPHAEDLWIRALRSRKRLAAPQVRRAILEATLARPNETIFGAPLTPTRFSAYLQPGLGARSLATVVVLPQQL